MSGEWQPVVPLGTLHSRKLTLSERNAIFGHKTTVMDLTEYSEALRTLEPGECREYRVDNVGVRQMCARFRAAARSLQLDIRVGWQNQHSTTLAVELRPFTRGVKPSVTSNGRVRSEPQALVAKSAF